MKTWVLYKNGSPIAIAEDKEDMMRYVKRRRMEIKEYHIQPVKMKKSMYLSIVSEEDNGIDQILSREMCGEAISMSEYIALGDEINAIASEMGSMLANTLRVFDIGVRGAEDFLGKYAWMYILMEKFNIILTRELSLQYLENDGIREKNFIKYAMSDEYFNYPF